ncbi:GMC family oxidoreductase [Ectothiorhodospiraceae bacterium 2226]|nr:GMC family oxidoreductase [Ectothiorhodospiraceae bacterium 2226]
MAIRLKPVDVVLVGMGWTGSILAKELSAAGLRVVGLERGGWRETVPNFQSPAMHDELRYAVRHGLMQDTSRETLTFRNNVRQDALPMRQLGSFLLGDHVGGAGVHWNGQVFRFHPFDFQWRSHHVERYGADIIDPELTIQDWPVSYDELEPYFDRFEYLCGIGGKAGNLRGEIQPGGNPFEGWRSREFPNPPMKLAYGGKLFADAARAQGYAPFPVPSANLTRNYTNPEGLRMNACTYCGYCERFGCEHFAKASPQTSILPLAMQNENFELRTHAHVTRVNTAGVGGLATGVTYVDARGREYEQPAELVILCAFGIHNVRLLLLSGIGEPYDPRTGEGVVGRNYSYQTMSSVDIFYPPDTHINPFMGAGALGMVIDDFNGDNFDHSELGFIGGAYIAAYTTGARPIEHHAVPEDTPRWGAAWKQAVARYFNNNVGLTIHGSSMAHRANYLDLDPTYRDAYGQPLLRMTFDFPANDKRMSHYVTARAAEIAEAMGGEQVSVSEVDEHYSIVPYQSTHNTGGAIMGVDPASSAINRYLQSWAAHNVFVMGASAFPQNPGYNPTDTVGALTYWAAEAILNDYVKNPRPLVDA